MKKTLTQELVEVQDVLKENIERINRATGTRDQLSIPVMKAEAITKLSRQYINGAQTLIRIGRLKNDISGIVTGVK